MLGLWREMGCSGILGTLGLCLLNLECGEFLHGGVIGRGCWY